MARDQGIIRPVSETPRQIGDFRDPELHTEEGTREVLD